MSVLVDLATPAMHLFYFEKLSLDLECDALLGCMWHLSKRNAMYSQWSKEPHLKHTMASWWDHNH